MNKEREVLFFEPKTFPNLETELGKYLVNPKHFTAQLIDLLGTLKGEDILKLPGMIRENFEPKKRAGRPTATRSGTNGNALETAANH